MRAAAIAIGFGIVTLALAACAIPARVEGMVYRGSPGTLAQEIFPLRNAIGVTVVEGGKDTVPFFTAEVGNDEFIAALRRSLESNGLLTEDESRARYALHASLVRYDRPVRGLGKSVRVICRYRLTEVEGGNIVFDEEIESSYTVTLGQELIAAARHRQANEGAMRKNFARLVEKLKALKPK